MTLYEEIFQVSNTNLLREINEKKHLLLILAFDHETVIGFKIGYERKEKHFYSWIGGVHPNYRKQGISSKLMRMQHKWCKENCYKTIQTKTKNKWRNMLMLNIKHEFNIIGTYTDEKGETKIILEKTL
ncbi:GNAT family N-acetyltransferase [Bacillus sp. S14(2024)]|uniref:GNAT family N-acetyltransferase n=1 Tax=Bacillus sp. S14(2024) TaxID=3162884 RepID=UPI003D1B2195